LTHTVDQRNNLLLASVLLLLL